MGYQLSWGGGDTMCDWYAPLFQDILWSSQLEEAITPQKFLGAPRNKLWTMIVPTIEEAPSGLGSILEVCGSIQEGCQSHPWLWV